MRPDAVVSFVALAALAWLAACGGARGRGPAGGGAQADAGAGRAAETPEQGSGGAAAEVVTPEAPVAGPEGPIVPATPLRPAGDGRPAVAVGQGGPPACEQAGVRVRRFGPALGEGSPQRLSLAVRGEGVAVAWVTREDTSQQREAEAHVALFSRDLALERRVRLGSGAGPSDVSIAATPEGWLVATSTYDGTSAAIVTQPLRPDLVAFGSATSITNAGGPILVGRPDGAPLLLYTGLPGGVGAALLDQGGQGRLWSTTLFASVTEPRFGSAVFTGDGFLVAMRENGVTVRRVGLDGQVGPAYASFGTSTEYPQLVWTGSEARVVWTDFSHTDVRWSRLDREGAPLGEPVVLGGSPDYYDPSPAAARGDDSVVLLGGYTGGTGLADQLDLLVVDGRGELLFGPCAMVAPEGGRTATSYALARLGDGYVTAWVEWRTWYEGTGLGLARFSPPGQ